MHKLFVFNERVKEYLLLFFAMFPNHIGKTVLSKQFEDRSGSTLFTMSSWIRGYV